MKELEKKGTKLYSLYRAPVCLLTEPEQKQQAEKETEKEEVRLSPEEVYRAVLDEYGFAMAADPYEEKYCMKDNRPQKLIDDPSLGERSQLYIYPDGTMLFVGFGGADLHGVTTYAFESDGVSLSEASEIYEGAFDLETVLAEKSGNQNEVERFDWKPIDTIWETEEAGDANAYIGQYINGQDWNAGTLTIEAYDEETVKVRLEAFKDKSDQQLSTIFEGPGYAVQDGLVVDISGRQVKLTRGDIGLILDAAPSLKLEWGLDPHIFSEEYISLTW